MRPHVDVLMHVYAWVTRAMNFSTLVHERHVSTQHAWSHVVRFATIQNVRIAWWLLSCATSTEMGTNPLLDSVRSVRVSLVQYIANCCKMTTEYTDRCIKNREARPCRGDWSVALWEHLMVERCDGTIRCMECPVCAKARRRCDGRTHTHSRDGQTARRDSRKIEPSGCRSKSAATRPARRSTTGLAGFDVTGVQRPNPASPSPYRVPYILCRRRDWGEDVGAGEPRVRHQSQPLLRHRNSHVWVMT